MAAGYGLGLITMSLEFLWLPLPFYTHKRPSLTISTSGPHCFSEMLFSVAENQPFDHPGVNPSSVQACGLAKLFSVAVSLFSTSADKQMEIMITYAKNTLNVFN